MSTFSLLVPRELGYLKTFSTKIGFLKSISEVCTSTSLIYSTKGGGGSSKIVAKCDKGEKVKQESDVTPCNKIMFQ